MNIRFVSARLFASAAIVVLLYAFLIPSVGFHGVLERIRDGKVDNISSYVYPLWNFYQTGRYASVNVPVEAQNSLRDMIETSQEIGVASFPVWSFSLEAPNYPKEVFPRGLPVFIHFDGLSGEVHEMNTINHYVGMAPMERGALYERALAPYALVTLALILVSFILYNNKWINRLMIIPILLPFLFIGIYTYWLYWFGHNLHMGAIKIEPFMPIFFGDGKVAQFTTHAYPAIGFWLLAAISLLSVFAWLLRRGEIKEQSTQRVMRMKHLIMLVILLMGAGTYGYLMKIDKEVDRLGVIADTIEKSKLKIPVEAKVSAPSAMEKETIKNEMAGQRKEQELKLSALVKKVGPVTKFKTSAIYKNYCSACHGVGGEGNIGSKLIGLSKDEILKKMVEYKRSEEDMHIAVIEHMTDEEMEELALEIAEFEVKGE